MRFAIAALTLAASFAATAPARAAGDGEPIPSLKWSFEGIAGTFDRAQLQRGLKVYTNICATCHGLRHVAYRNLTEIGLTPLQAKEVAATKEVQDIADDGQPKMRKADLQDRFVSPFANPQAAAASNNGKVPPDLSLITKARPDGSNYCHAILTGYGDPPADWKDDAGNPRKLDAGQHYNKYFAGHVIAMAAPLTSDDDDRVDYGPSGPKRTVDQLAKDVCAFLTWTAEPHMEVRKRTGIKVMLFLLIFTGVFYVIKRRVWRNVH